MKEPSLASTTPDEILVQAIQIIQNGREIGAAATALLTLAVTISNADMGFLELAASDSAQLKFAAGHNLPQSFHPGQAFGEEKTSRVIFDTNQPLTIPDYSSDTRASPELVRASAGSFLGFPVNALGNRLGVISLIKSTSRAGFTIKEFSSAETIVKLIGMAVLIYKLSRQANQYAHEAETLRQAAAAVISELDLDHVLDRILVQLKNVIDFDSAVLFLLEEELLRIVSAVGFPDNQNLIDQTFPADNPLFKETLAAGRANILEDAQSDRRFRQWTSGPPIRSWIGIPLHLRGRVIGFLSINSYQPNYFSESEAIQAQAFANEATIALENARLFKELQTLADRDALTGLWNRRHFIASAKIEFQKARRYHLPLSLILFDIDDFKSVNDVYGHVVGDQVLQGVASICSTNFRQIDLLGRYGGEEYMALLPNTPVYVARKVAERLRHLISKTPIDTDRGPIFISASFGVAGLDDTVPDLDALLKSADRAAYSAKFDGKNRVSISEDSPDL